jgi:hypothetical protein
VADPCRSAYGCPVLGSMPVRGDAHWAANVDAGWKTPGV